MIGRSLEMSGDGCSFQFSCSAKRLEDEVDGAKNCTVRIKWLNESGKQVKATTAGIGLLKPGESGHGNTTLGKKSSEMLLAQALRQREALMHDRIRSANLPKLAALPQKAHTHSGFKHMERFPHKPRN